MRCLFYAISIGLLTTLAGCASYGWADGSNTGQDEQQTLTSSVKVETLVVPAHLGLPAAELRDLLIQELELAGVPTASTGLPLRCTVSDDSTRGFDRSITGEIELSCVLLSSSRLSSPGLSSPDRGEHRVSAIGTGGDTFNATAPTAETAMAGSRRAEERAVADAIVQIAPQIADELSRPSNTDYEQTHQGDQP